MVHEIEEYQLGWHPTGSPAYRIRLKGNNQWSNWIKVSAADIAALGAIFNEKPVYLQPSGAITTGVEPIG